MAALQSVVMATNEQTPRFWSKVAKQFPGRSADDCWSQFFACHPTPPPPLTRAAASKVQPTLASPCPLQTPFIETPLFKRLASSPITGSPTRGLWSQRPARSKALGGGLKAQLAVRRKVRELVKKQQVEDDDYEEDAFEAFEFASGRKDEREANSPTSPYSIQTPTLSVPPNGDSTGIDSSAMWQEGTTVKADFQDGERLEPLQQGEDDEREKSPEASDPYRVEGDEEGDARDTHEHSSVRRRASIDPANETWPAKSSDGAGEVLKACESREARIGDGGATLEGKIRANEGVEEEGRTRFGAASDIARKSSRELRALGSNETDSGFEVGVQLASSAEDGNALEAGMRTTKGGTWVGVTKLARCTSGPGRELKGSKGRGTLVNDLTHARVTRGSTSDTEMSDIVKGGEGSSERADPIALTASHVQATVHPTCQVRPTRQIAFSSGRVTRNRPTASTNGMDSSDVEAYMDIVLKKRHAARMREASLASRVSSNARFVPSTTTGPRGQATLNANRSDIAPSKPSSRGLGMRLATAGVVAAELKAESIKLRQKQSEYAEEDEEWDREGDEEGTMSDEDEDVDVDM
eukprot:TRINITY_DN7563_c0_g1_i1.p1 TRINITY_DN7563_c0_g1~~TRINITY_DN7563_c0_g1_i1.p1  ORF type:complete len:603 (+),score=121.52 TRINITY_DN7563_c0_g1_i1:68-1810(+)